MPDGLARWLEHNELFASNLVLHFLVTGMAISWFSSNEASSTVWIYGLVTIATGLGAGITALGQRPHRIVWIYKVACLILMGFNMYLLVSMSGYLPNIKISLVGKSSLKYLVIAFGNRGPGIVGDMHRALSSDSVQAHLNHFSAIVIVLAQIVVSLVGAVVFVQTNRESSDTFELEMDQMEQGEIERIQTPNHQILLQENRFLKPSSQEFVNIKIDRSSPEFKPRIKRFSPVPPPSPVSHYGSDS